MKQGKKVIPFILLFSGIIFFLLVLMQPIMIWKYSDQIAVLFPKGIIALKERNLLFIIQGIMLCVIIPVFILTFVFSWKYRSSNPKGVYDPDLVDNVLAEVFWWSIPLIFTSIIAFMTFVQTYELDPFKPISSDKKPITIQVIALQWKWLFLYPEEKVASLNFFQIPVDTPIKFEITADAPMNSFWIPHLGGQIYAMPRMQTELNLIANAPGDYRGSSANLSGEGFAGMFFIARASTEEDYKKWLESAKNASSLNYEELAKPSSYEPAALYQLSDNTLFHKVMMKYE